MTDTNDVQMVDATGSDDQNDEVKKPNVGKSLKQARHQAMLILLLGLFSAVTCWHATFSKVSFEQLPWSSHS